MQQTFKRFFFKYYRISFIYKIIAILMNSIITFLCLSGCNIILNKSIKESYDFKKYNYKISKKEKINNLLTQSGVNTDNIFKLIETDSALNYLKIGQQLSWIVHKSGNLIELRWKISDFQEKIYKKNNSVFSKKNILDQSKLINKTIFIKKNLNFFKSALQSGLNTSEIKNIIEAIQWQVDFSQLNIGSNFNVVFSRDTLNKKNILLGVKLNNFGKIYYSIRAFNNNFYDINGFNKKDNYIDCSLFKKYRISSKFNLHRLHPITNRITQHLGVDLAMPQGTPVLATSNGKVIKTHFNKIAGFYISLKNKNKYITRYMHLKKILVKLGDQVKIGQKIALSGNTGRTTGPHLHYEIWINNHPINPINSKFIFCQELTEKEKKVFLEESKEIVKYLK